MGKETGAGFKRLREARGLSQSAVARCARGISRASIVALESGLPVKLGTLKVAANAMDMPGHEWLAFVISWVRDALGEELANEFVIKPLPERKTR